MAIALLTLALVGTVSFFWTLLLGYSIDSGAAVRTHIVVAFFTTMILVMAHSFIMFFLIATGVELKEMEKERGWGDSFRRRTVAMKGKVFGIATVALLLVIAQFVLGGATHTRLWWMPTWLHHGLAWVTGIVCLVTLWREYLVLGENNRLIDEAAERRRGDVPR